MAKSSIAILAASILALQTKAQVYTESVVSGPSGAPALATYTVTQDTGADVPLFQKDFQYPYLPYQADSGDGPRGQMQGYNICNSTTVGPESMCATAFLNDAEDFCLWGAPHLPGQALEVVADIEGEMVAYCTTPRHGARVIPAGAITGLQFTTTPDYVQIVGMIDQTALGLQASDSGGEEDPHGADSRGNPLGSLFYSSAFGPGNYSAYKQAHEWHYFIGGGIFCLKVCDPASAQGPELCQHIYDRIGCAYNAPADYAAINGTFTSCQGDDQLPPGVYVQGGQTMTYQQPPESLGVISTIPYTAAVPSSSQCTTFTSASLLTDLSSAASSAASSASAVPASITSGVASGASGVASSARAAAARASSATVSEPASSASHNVFVSSGLALLATLGLLIVA